MFIKMVKIVLDRHFFVAYQGILELLVVRHWEGLADVVAYRPTSSFSCVPQGTVAGLIRGSHSFPVFTASFSDLRVC